MYNSNFPVKLCLMFVCLWTSSLVHSCPYQECYCDGYSILCGNKGFTSLPASFATEPSNLPSLILEGNNITDIPARSLPANLTDISFNGNPILTVDDDAFQTVASTLSTLSFSDARFTRIPDALVKLRVLKHFEISNTKIDEWNIDVMKHIGLTLESIYLDHFDLQTLPEWIQYLSNATDISIIGSSVTIIPDNGFDKQANSLVSLTLNNNNLTSVPKALSKLSVLQQLYLRKNRIVDITWLPRSKNMHSLSLDNNRISDANQLGQVLRFYSKTLVDLDIDHNQLTTIPDMSFLIQIGEFNFEYNRISDPYTGLMPVKIYNIDFSNNLLPSIPHVYSSLKYLSDLMLTANKITIIRDTDIPIWVTNVQLDHNLVTELTNTSFPQNSSIISLNLNNNPLSHITPSAFTNLRLLTQLYLQGTKLTRVPVALGSLPNLNSLDISDCPNLICTCLEKSLTSWFHNLTVYEVSGDCGTATVYDFFVNLSPSCPNT